MDGLDNQYEESSEEFTDNETITDLINVMRGRKVLYELFSIAFNKEPDSKFIDLVAYSSVTFTGMANETGILEFKQGSDKINAFVGLLKKGDDVLSKAIEAYNDIFSGEFEVPREESAYLADPTASVVDLYGKLGYKAPTYIEHGPLHVSTQLAFMAFTADMIIEKLQIGNEKAAEDVINIQAAFFEDHMKIWIPEFCDRVIHADPRKPLLIQDIALILQTFIAFDRQFLDTLTE